MHAGKIIWSDHVEGLNNIYQKGAAVTCRHRPMAELRSSGVIWRQLGAPAEAPAVILQAKFLSRQRRIICKEEKYYWSFIQHILTYAPKKKKKKKKYMSRARWDEKGRENLKDGRVW